MNKKILVSVFVVLLVIAASLGATMAWFTDESDPIENVFTAGTVIITADESGTYSQNVTNWNPGDDGDKTIEVDVVGTKKVFLRANVSEQWIELDRDKVLNDEEFVEGHSANTRSILFDNDTNKEYYYYNILRQEWFNNTPNKVEWYQYGDTTSNPWPKNSGDENEWVYLNGYWYYTGSEANDGVIDTNGGDSPKKIIFLNHVKLKGEETKNEYQGATYTLQVTFEAIQSSHEAAFDEWEAAFIPGIGWDIVTFNSANDRYENDGSTYYWDGENWVLITS